jgi:phenylalanine-4-hydroxylase
MKQEYKLYKEEDQLVWTTLFERQVENLQGKSCTAYLSCLEIMKGVLNAKQIPDFKLMNAKLTESTGWSIEVVPGLIPVEDFFQLLAQRKFSASTWVRKMDQLDYLEEPDMFHDVFGHTPLLAEPKFAQFMKDFGDLGVEFIDDEEVVIQLQRLYWFTIEFGLIYENGRKVYGAGICSSFGETIHSLSENVEVIPFDLERVISTEFKTDVVQTLYFELESFNQLFEEFKLFRDTIREKVA